MSVVRVFYVYFHDTAFVPIHVAEVVNEMVNQGILVELFAYRNIKDSLSPALQTGRLKVHVIWAPRLRFVSEMCFVALLLPALLCRVLTRRPSVLYARHGGVSIATTIVARLTGLPCLIEVNDIPFDKLQAASRLKLAWVELYHRFSLSHARWVLPVTAQIASWLAATYRIPESRLRVVPNGVNIQRFRPFDRDEARRKHSIASSAQVICCLGSLFPWAGIETLIAATPAILDAHPHLHVAIGSGEEPYLGHIKHLVQEQHLEQYYGFYGFIPWEEAFWFISASDLCVAPFILKNTRSGLCSLRVLSYLACGRAVVGSDIPGLGDILERERIGVSVAMGNAAQLAEKINVLLAHPDELTKMGMAGRDYVVRNHSWASVINAITQCIEQCKG
jgi:glycosyltransferase involved in cell wall biosynthesis